MMKIVVLLNKNISEDNSNILMPIVIIMEVLVVVEVIIYVGVEMMKGDVPKTCYQCPNIIEWLWC